MCASVSSFRAGSKFDAFPHHFTTCRTFGAYRYHVAELWRRTARWLSQRDHTEWMWVGRIENDSLLRHGVFQPWPIQSFVAWQAGSGGPVRNAI
jgi:hypothetical protein